MNHAEQTLNIWEEQKRWREAEASGEDLSELARESRQNELTAMATCKLSNSEIVDICDDDCVRTIKRHIRRLSLGINKFRNEVRYIKSQDWDEVSKTVRIWQERWRHGADDLIMRRHALRSVLSAALVNLGKKEVGYEAITEKDVEQARRIPVEGLYDFERPARISGRFRAACPFHPEKMASFFIFKDNKFRCFGCGEHGDAIDFVKIVYNLEFIEAVKYLNRR